jgi:spore coat protein JB
MYQYNMPSTYRGSSQNENKMLKEISMVDFAIYDMTEYLDTHPDDEDAVAYIKQYITILKRLKKEYAALYGPLSLYDSVYNDDTDWKWSKMPLPWEGGCN